VSSVRIYVMVDAVMNEPIVGRQMKFCMTVAYKNIYKMCIAHGLCFKNCKVTARIFDVKSNKF
jgi:hypothetical protein